MIWADFGPVGNTEKIIWADYEQLFRPVFVDKFFFFEKHCSVCTKKLHNISFIKFKQKSFQFEGSPYAGLCI